ncbi:MAG TPA: cytochrome c [Terriglobales bacterium]|nr:cytochrome c [Terriglobales bacterium]
MRSAYPLPGVILLAAFCVLAGQQNPAPEKPKETTAPPTETPGPAPGSERKNPVKPSPEGLATAKKIYGYDCAMCHGVKGDGKGDLVESMDLKLKDWNDPAALAGMSDGELYEIILKGKGKMIGEGERASPERIWNLVNYVRAFAKKGASEKTQGDAEKP